MEPLAVSTPHRGPSLPNVAIAQTNNPDADWRDLLRRADPRSAVAGAVAGTIDPGFNRKSLGENYVPIFNTNELAEVSRLLHASGSEGARAAHWLARAMSTGGYRKVNLPADSAPVALLREYFPNFSCVLDCIEIQLALTRHQRPDDFHFTPMLLLGAPGIGKTYFAEKLARVFRTATRRISMASAQGGFEIGGTSQFWSNSTPGAVFRLLAENSEANSVLVLDELDKCEPDRHYPVDGPLIDLLEPRSSRRFRDQSVESEFDASKLVIVATANELSDVTTPIRSRFEVFQILPPDLRGREQVIRALWAELLRNVSCKVSMSRGAARTIRDSDLSPREILRTLRTALGRALRDGRTEIASLELLNSPCKNRIGF